jgi:hypothetical protein
VQRQLQSAATALPLMEKIFAGWGISLKPDTATVEMLVVKKAE